MNILAETQLLTISPIYQGVMPKSFDKAECLIVRNTCLTKKINLYAFAKDNKFKTQPEKSSGKLSIVNIVNTDIIANVINTFHNAEVKQVAK